MDGVPEVEMLDHGGGVGRVVVHVVTIADLARATVAAAVVRDDAVPLADEEEQLGVPIVRAQRPAVVEDDGLGVLRPPVLVVDIDAVASSDRGHLGLLCCQDRTAARFVTGGVQRGALATPVTIGRPTLSLRRGFGNNRVREQEG
jgi:hypothetical protein